MAELKSLEYQYSKDYKEVFEDIATLMFCVDLKLSHGVNRRINQKAIESDPVLIDGKSYAYQAKYYEPSTKLSQHKKDLIECIKGAADENVTNLYLFMSKNLPDKNHETGEETQFLKDIEATAKECNITLDWWSRSKIESSLDLYPFRNVREIYFRNRDDGNPNFAGFYSYIYKRFSESPEGKLFGNISLQQCYIEPSVDINGKTQTVHEYLESWVDSEERISVICGEPGHGKTSLCHKAMCDFYKKGWLTGKVSNVFCFSLNPARTNALANDSFNIYSLLSWGNDRTDREHILKEIDCKNALIFLDGFDELIEWYPKFNLRHFIESEITPFQEETGSHIIITSRSMAVDPSANVCHLQDGRNIPIRRLQLITKDQQIEWIQRYIVYCNEYSASKARDLEGYLDSYKRLDENGDLEKVLGIPIIFRLIVDTQYLPTTEKSITQIYDKLFHATWNRHRHSTKKDESQTKEALQNHALRIFVDNNDTAEADISTHSSWLFSFYTTHVGQKRVGFLHRSFYQHFLAHEILGWYTAAAASVDSEEDAACFRDNLSYLARRRLDKTTLLYIKELHQQAQENSNIDAAFGKAYEILKKTDGFIQGPSDQMHAAIEKNITPLDRANNTFWNIISVGSICGAVVSRDCANETALRLYDLDECIMANARFGKSDDRITSLWHAYLFRADLHGADLSRVQLGGAILSEADLSYADLSYASLTGTALNNAYLYKGNLRCAILKSAHLIGADLTEADLTGAFLKEADLTGACFIKADLTGANLTGVDLIGATLKGANLTGACFIKADLTHADFRGAYIKDVDFSGAILNNTRIDSKNASKMSRKYDVSQMVIEE